ncbi:hypothetical protein GXW82_02220 [Streptacidiphilus sp. 4-A2]|nr:hypothetical protein [Streptacidiphilus sp. 4-A2]
MIARHAVYTEEIARRCRDLWGRMIGVTLWPFQDFGELVSRTDELTERQFGGPEPEGGHGDS